VCDFFNGELGLLVRVGVVITPLSSLSLLLTPQGLLGVEVTTIILLLSFCMDCSRTNEITIVATGLLKAAAKF